jgi:hypothetical protein
MANIPHRTWVRVVQNYIPWTLDTWDPEKNLNSRCETREKYLVHVNILETKIVERLIKAHCTTRFPTIVMASMTQITLLRCQTAQVLMAKMTSKGVKFWYILNVHFKNTYFLQTTSSTRQPLVSMNLDQLMTGWIMMYQCSKCLHNAAGYANLHICAGTLRNNWTDRRFNSSIQNNITEAKLTIEE